MKKENVSRKGFLGIGASAVAGLALPTGLFGSAGKDKSAVTGGLKPGETARNITGAELPRSFRIGLAQLVRGRDIPEGVEKIRAVLAECSRRNVELVCFPESYLPGLRGGWRDAILPAPDQRANEQALLDLRGSCRSSGVAAIVGMEWITEKGLENRAFVISADGEVLGHQTKNQITPGGEEEHYVPENTRRMFMVNGVPFGIVICHEGWRYPETVRWAAVRGARIVFQPQVTGGNPSRSNFTPRPWGQGAYYEQAMILRSMENSIYFASVNEGMEVQRSATSLIDPDGNLVDHLPLGEDALMVQDLDMSKATGFYAGRYRPELYEEG